jgi:hypothetical protein
LKKKGTDEYRPQENLCRWRQTEVIVLEATANHLPFAGMDRSRM